METEVSGDDDAAVKKGDAKKEKPKEIEKPKEEEKKEEPISTPLVARPAQNWSDLFFIIDILSYNIDSCDLILFMTKINPVPGLENKKVNVDISYWTHQITRWSFLTPMPESLKVSLVSFKLG